jgi:hypothetical protein
LIAVALITILMRLRFAMQSLALARPHGVRVLANLPCIVALCALQRPRKSEAKR